jgi:hypothetical protein
MKLDFFPCRFWKYIQISNFVKIRPVGAELFHADGQTDGPGEATSRFSQFCERRLQLLNSFSSSYSLFFCCRFFFILSKNRTASTYIQTVFIREVRNLGSNPLAVKATNFLYMFKIVKELEMCENLLAVLCTQNLLAVLCTQPRGSRVWVDGIALSRYLWTHT